MIIGKRITLRAWEKDDAEVFALWLNDPEVSIGLGNAYPAVTREQQEKFIAEHANQPNYSIVLNENQQLIGSCGLHFLDQQNRFAELGIIIGEKVYWNQGYGREAISMLLEIGFEGLGLNRIELYVHDLNQRGYRCYLAAGFVEEGRLRKRCYIKSAFVDDIVMSVLAEEYWARKAGAKAS
jgi:RimJ/RimL family protein N-acetyltransferase